MIDNNDPFAGFESEHTLIKPKPRVAATSAAAPAPSDALSPATQLPPLALNFAELPHLNPIVAAASGMLRLSTQLRQLVEYPNPAGLYTALVNDIQRFESTLRKQGVANEKIVGARYVLCTALDEAIANTPWGSRFGWSNKSLLVHFHNEAWGGEKVFQLLGRLAQNPDANRELLEFIYCILALGFEGRYRVLSDGHGQLTKLRERLAEMIRKHRPAAENDLSPHWRGVMSSAQTKAGIPLWLAATALAALLALAFAAFRFTLNQSSDQAFALLSGLRAPAMKIAPAAAKPAPPRLAKFLEPEIQQGLVSVKEDANQSVITMRGDSFFASGSGDVSSSALPVLQRIAQALAEVPGPVLITGHSDNVPIRSMRYPSNWHLSQARAQSVLAVIANYVPGSRLRSEGRADAEPIAPNDTPANRAKNRRVEITLITAVNPGKEEAK